MESTYRFYTRGGYTRGGYTRGGYTRGGYTRGGYTRGFHYHQPIVTDSMDKRNITKNGHLFKKTFEDGDEKLILEPHRDDSGIFVYKKYKKFETCARLLDCTCHSYGYLCQYCIVLNTSSFYDLDVPLNPEDFETWKDFFLKKQKWSDKNFYNWLKFWIQAYKDRYSSHYERCMVFFGYNKFFHKKIHAFFYYLFQFTTTERVFHSKDKEPLHVDVNGGVIKKFNQNQKIQPNCLAIITCHAMIRLSFNLYGKGGRVTRTMTSNRKTIVHFVYEENPRQDSFSFYQKQMFFQEKQRWKRVFQYTIDEINNEVRFRPNMCGMEECRLSFLESAKILYI